MTIANRPRALMIAGAVGLLVLAAAGGGLWAAFGGTEKAKAPTRPEAQTVEVTRGDLRQVQEVPGAMGFGRPIPVLGRGDGIITWLPSAGVVVPRGRQLYRVDDAPIAVLYGDMPMYRTLTADLEKPKGTKVDPPLLTGHDVDLIAANMAALGYYTGATIETYYGSTLSAAVARWQEDRGVEPTGVLELGDVVMTRGPVRVDEVTAQVGGDASGEPLTLTLTRRTIVVEATPELSRSLTPGLGVLVTLGDGTRVRTTVSAIGGRASSEGEGPPTVAVTLGAKRPERLAKAPLGALTARFITAAAEDVLHVPVTALLALSGGGYALERPDGTLVPIELGMIVDGQVEVEGIDEGATVVVAS